MDRWVSVLAGGVGACSIVMACSSTPASDPAGVVDPATPPPATETPSEAGADAAASGDATVDVDSSAASLSIAQFDAAIAAAVCQKLTACCADADYAQFFQQFSAKPYDLKSAPSKADCAAVLAKQYLQHHGKWAASITLGRIKYDPARGKSCVDAVTAATCGVPLTKAIFDARCFAPRGNEVFAKVAPLGSPCADVSDGTFYGECDPKYGFCGTSKTCEPWKKTGEPCSVTPTRQFCAPDLACDGLSPSAPGKCTAAPIIRQLGESCVSISGPYIDCAAGAYCDDASGLCAAKKADGAACSYDFECATSHPYTCTPFGAGTCGSTSFCGGKPDGGP